MSTLSPEKLSSLRSRLEMKLHSVTQRHAQITAHLTNSDRTLPQDGPDRAQVLENDEVLDALDDHDREEIFAVRLALHRMEQGRYGTCTACGEAISLKRLEALPLVTTCMSCAAAAES